MGKHRVKADVCLILEGTYPYVSGGLSSWTHDLIRMQDHLRFSLLTIMPPGFDGRAVYELPRNVVEVHQVRLQQLPMGEISDTKDMRLFDSLKSALLELQHGGRLPAFKRVLQALQPHRGQVGAELLLNSRASWEMLRDMYQRSMNGSSFLDYFWSWRSLLGGMYSVLLDDLPEASMYHALCTGYAGLYAARAHLETGRPTIVTEHGIYTNERRIEIALADWLHEGPQATLSIDKVHRDIRDMWMEAFESYSRVCYDACDRVVTLFEGNHRPQLADGADPQKLMVIPNGIDYERYSRVERERDPNKAPTIALIGRVVPIKDVKTFLRACAQLRERIPSLRAYVMGPTDEDVQYYDECRSLVRHLELDATVEFTGKVDLGDYLPRVDVLVLSSISESQPLVILEAGAAGIPTVATNVGACSELILGRSDEEPRLGASGAVVPVASPAAMAEGIYTLLSDMDWYSRCSYAARERVRLYYNAVDQREAYRALYESYLQG